MAIVTLALLGTLRRDSSPRISPIEPCIAEGQLLIGVMVWSRKADDLRRDPRYALHSAVTDPDSGEGELKLHGQLVTDTALRRRRCSVMQPCGSRVKEGTRRCKHR